MIAIIYNIPYQSPYKYINIEIDKPIKIVQEPIIKIEPYTVLGTISVDNTVLSLYGRRRTRDRWNYYTKSDGYNPVLLPISYKNRKCMEDIGCEEIITDDEIWIEGLQKKGKINRYKLEYVLFN